MVNRVSKRKIYPRQYGSLQNSTTTHALLSFVHHLLTETGASKNTRLCYAERAQLYFITAQDGILSRKKKFKPGCRQCELQQRLISFSLYQEMDCGSPFNVHGSLALFA